MSENQDKRDDQQKEPATRMSINDAAKKITKGNKVAGIIVAIAMIVLGILLMARPIATEIVLFYLAAVGFLIYGIYQIIVYVRTPSDLKNGMNLANGIILILLAVLILLSSAVSVVITFAFLFGFVAMFTGINQIAAASAVKKAGGKRGGWLIASGIINIVLSIFFIVTPFMAEFAFGIIAGVYLIVGGIALLIEAASGNTGRPA